MGLFRRRNKKLNKHKPSKAEIKNLCEYCGSSMELTDRWCPVCDRDSRWDEEEELDNW